MRVTVCGSGLQEMALRLATKKQTGLHFYAVANDFREFPSSKNNSPWDNTFILLSLGKHTKISRARFYTF